MPDISININGGQCCNGGVSGIMAGIGSGAYDGAFAALYPQRSAMECRNRYKQLAGLFNEAYPSHEGCGGGKGGNGDGKGGNGAALDGGGGGGIKNVIITSAPGRTEVCGNHTDHQRGSVLAAAVDLDIICFAAPNADNIIRVISTGHSGIIEIDLGDTAPLDAERGHGASLVRGLAAWFKARGVGVTGFDAYTTSDVLVGSGLSSSAAFEVVVGTAMNALYGASLSPLDIAMAGQYAENEYFGKPSGLMDQTASSVGGFVRIDFADQKNPVVEPIQFDIESGGLKLCVVNTKGSHADLIGEYASIPNEMRAVAAFFGKQFLSGVDEGEFYKRLPDIRQRLGEGDQASGVAADRALLRAMHFFNENKAVAEAAGALLSADKARFLDCVLRSGLSSSTCLQNIYAGARPSEQGLSIALALSESLLRGKGGAWRVHGGGFAGTIMAFVPGVLHSKYVEAMDAVFGDGSCITLSVRKYGGIVVTPELGTEPDAVDQ